MEGSGFFARLAVLSFRPSLLLTSSRICVRAGDSLRADLLGYGPRMAVGRAFPVRSAEDRFGQHSGSGSEHAAAAGRDACRLRADHQRDFIAWIRGLGFSRQL